MKVAFEVLAYDTKEDFESYNFIILAYDGSVTEKEAAKIASEGLATGKYFAVKYQSTDRERIEVLFKKDTAPSFTSVKIDDTPKNLHIIKVTTQSSTKTLPARVKLRSERFPSNKAVFVRYSSSNKTSNIDIAVEWLTNNGYPVISTAEGIGCSYVLTNRFKPLIS